MANLHSYLGAAIKGHGAVPLAVGGVEDHVHLLIGMRTDQTVADLVRDIKRASSIWVSREFGLKDFAWQVGYAALSVSPPDVPGKIKYINNQEEHHRTIDSLEELRKFLEEHGIRFDERYLE